MRPMECPMNPIYGYQLFGERLLHLVLIVSCALLFYTAVVPYVS